MMVTEILMAASFNEWLVSAFALFGVGALMWWLVRSALAAGDEYIERKYGDD